jgi:vacuolar-type H+-ATPase subunit H
MAQELFQAVQQAEEAADQIIQEAQQSARELIKTTEAQIKAEEREASLAHRAQYQSMMEKKRKDVEKNIEEERPQALSGQKESLKAARGKLDQVSQMIFERIWNDGDR